MKRILLAGSALLAVSTMATQASAAETTGGYDWSGFYVGANAGALFGSGDASARISSTAPWAAQQDKWSSGNENAFTGGGLLGYNWQIDSFVLGVEADINTGGTSGGASSELPNGVGPIAYTNTYYNSTWFGTVRGRAGYAVDNLLFYGTAGLAYGGFQFKNQVDGVSAGNSDSTAVGWTAGAGMEYGIGNWSLGLEYLYVDLGSDDYRFSTNDYTVKNDVDYRSNILRGTVKYRF